MKRMQSLLLLYLLPPALSVFIQKKQQHPQTRIMWNVKASSDEECIKECEKRATYPQYVKGRCYCFVSDAFSEKTTTLSDNFKTLAGTFCEHINVACACVKLGKCTFRVKEKLRCLATMEHDIVNLSECKPSLQSSTYANYQAKYANDGHFLGRVSSTNKEWKPYWEVDFEEVAVITLIRIHLPVQHYMGLKTFMEVLIMYHPNTWYPCKHISSLSGRSLIEITCDRKVNVAQYLRIVLGRSNVLQLLEVEAFGYYL